MKEEVENEVEGWVLEGGHVRGLIKEDLAHKSPVVYLFVGGGAQRNLSLVKYLELSNLFGW